MRGGGLGPARPHPAQGLRRGRRRLGRAGGPGRGQVIDEVAGARRADAGASTGTYLALAALNRLVAPCSKLGFADWWAKTAAPRFTKIPAGGAGSPPVLGRDARRHRWRSWPRSAAGSRWRSWTPFGLDCSSVALDMTNFATFIDTGNGKAPIAQRGKAKQKRSDLRLVGLGLVVTRDGGIPLTWHAYPGDRPDVTQFPAMIKAAARPVRGDHGGLRAAARGHDRGLRRRPEQRGQLRVPGRHRAALHRVGARQRLPGPDRPARLGPLGGGPGALRRADRLRHPPRRLRRRAAGDPDPLPGAARKPGPRVRRHHPGQGRQEARRAGRHPGPRQDPPAAREGGSRDRQDHRQAVGTPGHHLAAIRRAAQRPAPDLAARPQAPAPPWKTRSSASTC